MAFKTDNQSFLGLAKLIVLQLLGCDFDTLYTI